MLILVPAIVLASQLQMGSLELRTHKWFCTANGVDSQQHPRSVSGPFRLTQPSAEQAAIEQCLGEGLFACSVRTCIDESNPSLL